MSSMFLFDAKSQDYTGNYSFLLACIIYGEDPLSFIEISIFMDRPSVCPSIRRSKKFFRSSFQSENKPCLSIGLVSPFSQETRLKKWTQNEPSFILYCDNTAQSTQQKVLGLFCYSLEQTYDFLLTFSHSQCALCDKISCEPSSTAQYTFTKRKQFGA